MGWEPRAWLIRRPEEAFDWVKGHVPHRALVCRKTDINKQTKWNIRSLLLDQIKSHLLQHSLQESKQPADAAGWTSIHGSHGVAGCWSGVKLGLRSVPVATACAIYHRFFMEVPLEPYDPYLVAMAALYLAGKVEEQHLRTRDIINVSHRYLHPRSDPLELDTHFWELRDSIVQCELLMLRVLCFRVSFQHPHKYLLHYLLSLKHWMNRHSWDRTPVAVAAWALLRDSYHGPLCLQHAPQHIAVSVLYLALQCYGVEVPGDAEAEQPWWQVFSEDLSKNVIDQIVLDLIHIYALDTEIS